MAGAPGGLPGIGKPSHRARAEWHDHALGGAIWHEIALIPAQNHRKIVGKSLGNSAFCEPMIHYSAIIVRREWGFAACFRDLAGSVSAGSMAYETASVSSKVSMGKALLARIDRVAHRRHPGGQAFQQILVDRFSYPRWPVLFPVTNLFSTVFSHGPLGLSPPPLPPHGPAPCVRSRFGSRSRDLM